MNIEPEKSAGTTREFAAVINTASGSGTGEALANELPGAFAPHGIRVEVLTVSKEEGPEALAKKAVRLGVECVLLCGGDGTVSGGLAGLANCGVPGALFPIGTGNLLGHNLDVLGSTADLVSIAVHGRPRAIDLIKITTDDGKEYWSSVMSGIGYDARIVEGADSETKKAFGPLAYVLSAFRNFRPNTTRVWLEIDGGAPVRTRASSITIANAGSLQGGLPLFPDARIDDGLMDIGVVRASRLPDWFRIFVNVLLRRVREDEAIELYQCKKARIYFQSHQRFQYDGEPASMVHSLDLEVYPAAVSIMVPSSSGGNVPT